MVRDKTRFNQLRKIEHSSNMNMLFITTTFNNNLVFCCKAYKLLLAYNLFSMGGISENVRKITIFT